MLDRPQHRSYNNSRRLRKHQRQRHNCNNSRHYFCHKERLYQAQYL